jgi:hypothetical protein
MTLKVALPIRMIIFDLNILTNIVLKSKVS